jgi:hypothetical protein
MRSFLTTLGIILLMSNPYTPGQAQDLQVDDLRFFRIGTGGVAGTYHRGRVPARPAVAVDPKGWSLSRNRQMVRLQT